MFNTINGFDLLLIITIVVMGFKIYNLNRECESYVSQVIRMAWDLDASEKERCYRNCPECAGFTNPWWTAPDIQEPPF